jgi:hypothetical protein
MEITPHSGTLVNSEILRARLRAPAVGAAQQRVGLDADFAQLLHRVLGGLGLELAGRGDEGQVGQVHEGGVVGPELQAQLAHGFQEGQGLDVAHGAADLDDGHIHGVVVPMPAPRLMYSWISLVTCGMTCTVLPR